MSRSGQPEIELLNAQGMEIVIVASNWHREIMDALISSATDYCVSAGAEIRVVKVPGSFEIPIAASAAIDDDVDAVIALGVIIRGETPHFEYVAQGVTQGLVSLMIESGTPVGFGVLTCDNEKQAIDRAGLPGSKEDKGKEAAYAAIATALMLQTEFDAQ
jgi:6,7-dimethyl-8-ribityllumazine synthase